MSTASGSALLRRHIGRRFVVLRTRAGLTQQQAADGLERSRATIGRIEEGDEKVRFRTADVRQMLDLYSSSPEEAEVLLALTAETRNGHRKSWWHDYTETALPSWFGLYVSLEDGAETIRQYQPELVPGLLQTRAYTEQVMRSPAGYLEDGAQHRVEVRMKRQSLLTRARAPRLSVMLNEAVLHRVVGGTALMAEQLQHIIEIIRRANVSVRIVPWSAGVHGGMSSSGFSLMDFPADAISGEPLEPPMAYVDYFTGALYLTKPDEVAAYQLVWRDLDQKALSPADSLHALSTARKGFHP